MSEITDLDVVLTAIEEEALEIRCSNIFYNLSLICLQCSSLIRTHLDLEPSKLKPQGLLTCSYKRDREVQRPILGCHPRIFLV